MIERYEDFEIIITQQGNQPYADLGTAPGGRNLTKPIPITLPPEERVAWAEAKQGRKSEAELAELGHQLFEALITGELASNWNACLGEIRRRPDTGLRLRFSLQAEAMTEAPLELLCRRTTPIREFLALDLLTPVVRSPRSGEPAHERPITLPLRMLVVMANPKLQKQFDPGAEKTSLEEALADLIQAGKLIIYYLGLTDPPNADYATLQRTLAQTKSPYDVVHFIGHGALPDAHDEETEGILLLVDPGTGRRYDVRASDLAGILARNGVRVAVLQACDGACSGTHNVFQGVAQRLIAGGVPAVVAMQCPVDKDVATCFCGQLYHFWLTKGGLPLERAVTEARQAVRQRFSERVPAWWTPVLFIRLESTEVLKVHLTEMATLRKRTVLLKKYKILKLLGSGALGNVYLAEDMDLKRKVAVKHLKPEYAADEEALERFREEASTIANLRHPNIATVHGLEKEDDQSYIIMEHADRGTLADFLAKEGSLSITHAIDLAIALCRALVSVHRREIFHRDIKPSNILLIKSGDIIAPKLSDFGLSGAPTSGFYISSMLQYASPEQLRGDPVDARSDIYSLGMVLYAMLTGKPPFAGSKDEILRAHREQEPSSPRNVRKEVLPSLEKVVLKALSKKPKDRYQTTREMAKDLEIAHQEELEKEEQVHNLYVQAEQYISSQDWPMAVKVLEAVSSLDPNYEDAVQWLAEARKKKHARWQILYTEGMEFLNNGEWERAIDRFEEIHRSDPGYKAVDARLAEARRKKRLQDFYDEHLPVLEREDQRSPKPTQYSGAKAAWIIVVGVVTVLLATLCVLLSGDATWEILRHLPGTSVYPSPVVSAPTATSTSTLTLTPFSTSTSIPLVSPTATRVLPTATPTPPTAAKTPSQTPVPPTATVIDMPTPAAPPTATDTPRPPTLAPTPTVTPQPTGPITLTIYLRHSETDFVELSDDQVDEGILYMEGKCVYGEAAVQIGETTYHFDKPKVGPGEPEQLPDPWRVEFEFAKELKDHTRTAKGDGCAEGTPGFDPKKAQFWVGTLGDQSAVGEDNPYSLTMKLYEGDELRENIQVFFTVRDTLGREGGGGGSEVPPTRPPGS